MTPDQVKLAAYVAARSVEDGDCTIWTGFSYGNGAGAHMNGKKFMVVRALWEAKHGPIPDGKRLRCTCQRKLCISLDHRKLMTYKQIAKEVGALGLMGGPVRGAKIAATKRKQAKTTDADVRAIRESTESCSVLAARYGVSRAAISKYRRHASRKDYGNNPFAGLLGR